MISYAITDPSTLDFNHLVRDLKRFSQKASMIVYRDKSASSKHGVDFVKAAKVFGFEKIIIHGDPVLANAAGADGVHLSSLQLDEIADAKAMNLFVVVSTHNIDEVKKAEKLGADAVINVRFMTSAVMGSAAEMLAYGTAVKLK